MEGKCERRDFLHILLALCSPGLVLLFCYGVVKKVWSFSRFLGVVVECGFSRGQMVLLC